MGEVTEKQLLYIQELQERSFYPLPIFLGKTQHEASEYISKYQPLAYEDGWTMVQGY